MHAASAHQSPRAAEVATLALKRAMRQHGHGNERVLVVDDCTLFRENLAAILDVNGVTIAGMAWDLPSLVSALGEADESLLLVNVASAGSLQLLQTATELRPGLQVVVIGASENDEAGILACAEAGVAGYHMRPDSLADLVLLIREVSAGRSFVPPAVSAILHRRLALQTSQPHSAAADLVLTTRESQILTMLELGRSNRDIADQLDIAVHTVKNHVHNLLTKLAASTRGEAAALSRSVKSPRVVRGN